MNMQKIELFDKVKDEIKKKKKQDKISTTYSMQQIELFNKAKDKIKIKNFFFFYNVFKVSRTHFKSQRAQTCTICYRFN